MSKITRHTQELTSHTMDALRDLPDITIYGPTDAEHRTPLVAFNATGWHPVHIAEALNDFGVEPRAGCHCATLAHRHLQLDPLESCRLSFALYNTIDDVDLATEALRKILASPSPDVVRNAGQHLAAW